MEGRERASKMGTPLDYRNAVPDLASSSSPLLNMAALYSSPPLSPQSPTPLRNMSANRHNGLLSPTTSNPHPFSGSAKAKLGSHPSFGKDQLRSKHLRGSPDKAAAEGHKSWALSGIQKDKEMAREEALGQHFMDSSDDNPSSDWSGTVDPTSASTAPSSFHQSMSRNLGLGIDSSTKFDNHLPRAGLGEAFQEPTSPSMGRNVKLKARTFSRTQTSSKDPFSAGAGSGSFNPMQTSPKIHRETQRRRLTGSSPKKLSRTAQTGQFGAHSSDDSSDESLPPWEQMVKTSPNKSRFNWSSVVERVFEDVDGYIELTKQGLTRIDPVVADLSKFVSIPPLRNEDSPTKSTDTSGTSSSSNPFERTMSTSSFHGSPSGRTRVHTGEHSSSSKLQLYLTGNRLQTFSSALFELHNLVVLTIGNNDLEELPPAIGQLVNLRELNVSQNRMRYLPAEIQKLKLTSFLHFPNPFEQPPSDAHLTLRSTFGSDEERKRGDEKVASLTPTSSMGPPALPLRSLSHARLSARSSFAATGNIESSNSKTGQATEIRLARYLGDAQPKTPRLPSLMETCIRVLLEPEEGDEEGEKVLLEQFESGCLANLNKGLDENIIKSLEAARRSAVKAWGRVRPASTTEGTWCSGAEAASRDDSIPARRKKKARTPLNSFGLFTDNLDSVPASMEFSSADEGDDGEASNEMSGEERIQTRRRSINVEEQLDRGDDSRRNPWFNRCPNPLHYQNEGRGSNDNQKQQRTASNNQPFDWPGPLVGGRIFHQPSTSRLEWVSHVAGVPVAQVRLDDVAALQDTKTPTLVLGTNCIPLQWRGCGSRCLKFLE